MAQAMAVSIRPRPYQGPVAVSVLLHVAILIALSANLSWCRHEIALPPVPEHVRAVVIERSVAAPRPGSRTEKPKETRKETPPEVVRPVAPPPPPAKPLSRPVPKPTARPEVVARKPVPAPPESRPVAPPAKPVAAAKPAPVVPVANFDALLAQEDRAQQASEAARRELAQQAARDASARSQQEAKIVNDYKALIQGAIERRWNKPPGARGGLQTELRITLLPGGEVYDVQMIRSSGDTAFDRSAENAVRLAGRLPVPADPAVFNAYFRNFKFLFRPEGPKP